MILPLRVGALFFAALFPWHAFAQEEGFASKSDDDLIAIISDEAESWLSQPCEIGVPVLKELRTRYPDGEDFIWRDLYAQAICAAERQDDRQGAHLMAELERRYPEEFAFTRIGFYFDMRLENADAILTRLQSIDVERLARLDSDFLWPAVRMLNRQKRTAEVEQRVLGWYETKGLDPFNDSARGALAVMAIRATLRLGRPDAVPGLLALVRSPDAYVTLLADRRYSSVWPLIEERAGENLARVSQENVERALVGLEANETDRDRFSEAARALYYAGRFQNAVALAERWRTDGRADREIEEGDGWALNIQAYAYDALGQPEKADAVFDELAKLSPEDRPWLVNFVINRASRLVGQGRWEEGLEAASLARNIADHQGSTYAKMIIARDHTCALIELDRADEVADELAYVRENSEISTTLAAQGLMCAGYKDEAASMIIAALENESERSRLIENLQPPEFSLFYTPSIIPQIHELLSESEALSQAFDQYGRIIPKTFTPIASQRRKHWLVR